MTFAPSALPTPESPPVPPVAGLLVEHFGAQATLIALTRWTLVGSVPATINRSIRHAPPLD
jgi:hypothetical protein